MLGMDTSGKEKALKDSVAKRSFLDKQDVIDARRGLAKDLVAHKRKIYSMDEAKARATDVQNSIKGLSDNAKLAEHLGRLLPNKTVEEGNLEELVDGIKAFTYMDILADVEEVTDKEADAAIAENISKKS